MTSEQYYRVSLTNGSMRTSEVVRAESIQAAKITAECRRPGFKAEGPVVAGVGPCGTGSCSASAS